jgi:uncharacterized membrane protein required for colicin V production
MYTDFFLLVAILLFGISGFIQGFVLQIISLLSLVSILVFSTPLARWIKESASNQSIQQAPTFVLWCFSALAIGLIALLIRAIYLKAKKQKGHSPIDRWLGLGVGLTKGAVFALLAGLLLIQVPPELRRSFAELDRDLKHSRAIETSRQINEWEFIPSVAELRRIQKDLRSQEALQSPTEELLDIHY